MWRTALEAVHGLLTGPSIADATDIQPEEDVLVGRFAYLNLPKWGGYVTVFTRLSSVLTVYLSGVARSTMSSESGKITLGRVPL